MKEKYLSLRRFCLFIGYDRSGQSLVAASLDAHAHVAISHGISVLRFMRQGIPREELFDNISQTAQIQGERGRRGIKGVTYGLPNQHHGKGNKLYVIGDRHAADTSSILAQGYWSEVDRLYTCVQLRVKWIHVIRHPLDNIGDLTFKGTMETIDTLEEATELYFRYADAVKEAKKRIQKDDFIDVYFEKWKKHPQDELRRLCGLLDLNAPKDYLDDCATLIERERRGTRRDYEWKPGQQEDIMKRAENYPWLAPYLKKKS